EATRVPASWISANLNHDLVVVPTESSRQAWIVSGTPPEKVRICPLGINTEIYSAEREPFPFRLPSGEPISKFGTRFLSVADACPGKNMAGLLRTWMRNTRSGEDAALIIKLGCSTEDRRAWFDNELRGVENKLGRVLAQAAPVLIISQTVADSEMPRIYR